MMPEHRGHRLGTLLKLATLEIAPARAAGAGRHPHRHRRRQPRDAGDQPRLRVPARSSGCTRCSVAMAEVRPDLWPLLDRGAPVSPVWESDAFADEMRSWCSEVLDRDVQLEVQKIRGWSAVWRVTDGRDVWFAKQNCPGQAFEAALLGVLSRLSDRVVPVTAVDLARGFLLTPDQGPVLRGHRRRPGRAVVRGGARRRPAPARGRPAPREPRGSGPAPPRPRRGDDVRRDSDRAVRRPARGRPAAAGRGRRGPAAGAAARGGGVGRPAARPRPAAHAGPQRPARLQRVLRRRSDALLRLRRRRARRPLVRAARRGAVADVPARVRARRPAPDPRVRGRARAVERPRAAAGPPRGRWTPACSWASWREPSRGSVAWATSPTPRWPSSAMPGPTGSRRSRRPRCRPSEASGRGLRARSTSQSTLGLAPT